MANKVYNMEGGLHSAAAYSAFENSMWGSCVASSSDFVATAGTGMNISLSAGNGMIDTGLGFSRRIASDAVNTISVDAASSANPRKDALVAYIDNGVTPTTSVLDNTNDILKFACVAGSPAATPAAPSDATIQTAIGAGNPYVVLWYVTVPKSATSLSTATFTDNRNISSKIDGSNIKDGTVTSSKIDCVTLWSGTDNGTSSTLNLSETVNNFKYLVIYFHDDQNFKGSLKAFMNNTGGQGCLFMNKCGANGDILYITSRRFNVSGQTFTKDKEVVVALQGTSISVTATTNYLRVERIIGYKS